MSSVLTPADAGLVGTAAARAVHGLSAGADAVLLGATGPAVDDDRLVPVGELLRELGTSEPISVEPLSVGHGSAAGVLNGLAELAQASKVVPLVVASADLRASLPALLDLLDTPAAGTAAVTVLPTSVEAGLGLLAPVRVGGDGVLIESVGTSAHAVTRPDRALLGVLRVDAGDRHRAARAWRAAASASHAATGSAAIDAADPGALAVLALVRAGLPVRAARLGPFRWSRPGVSAAGAPGSPWQQRLRGSSRGGDGLVSTVMTRRLSRPVTGFGLAHGWSPNLVTMASLVTGLVAAALVATGNRWAWVLAAVLLQVALVVDCCDGEIARFTRRFSPFGAWLDAVGDRVKEYSVLAAVALVAVRQGHEGWILATAAMAVVTMRHLEDFPYADRQRPLRASRPEVLPFERPRDGGADDARTTFADPPTARSRVVTACKQVLHLPIAERYVLLCLGLLTFRPRLVLWLLIGATLVAAAYTQGGRVVQVLRGRDSWAAAPLLRDGRQPWGFLDHQLDLGPLARGVGRRVSLPFVVAPLAALLLAGSGLLDLGVHGAASSTSVLVALVSAGLLGASVRPPLRHRLAWQLPVLLWLAEVVVVCAVSVAALPAGHRGPAFAFAAAVAWHRYDVVYRLRDTGTPAAAELTLFGLGVDGRVVVLLAVTAWAPHALGAVLAAGAAYLAVLYVVESALGWRRQQRNAGRAVRPESLS